MTQECEIAKSGQGSESLSVIVVSGDRKYDVVFERYTGPDRPDIPHVSCVRDYTIKRISEVAETALPSLCKGGCERRKARLESFSFPAICDGCSVVEDITGSLEKPAFSVACRLIPEENQHRVLAGF